MDLYLNRVHQPDSLYDAPEILFCEVLVDTEYFLEPWRDHSGTRIVIL